MTTQIAVRLPDDAVAFLDARVRDGRARSRADVISRLIAREQRRQRAAEDVHRIVDDLATNGPDEDMDALAAWGADQPIDLD